MSGPRLPFEDSAEELYEHAPCGYLSTLPDGTIVRVNQTFLTWTGFRREDLVDQTHFQDLLSAGGRIFHETHLAPMLRMQGAVREIAVDLVCPKGTLPVLLNAVVKVDAAGTPLLTRIMVLDATERRGYERELLHARAAERMARERTERLQRVTAALASALDVRRVGAVVVEELVADVGADRALIVVATGGGDEAQQAIACHGPGMVLPSVDEPVFEEQRDADDADEPQALAVLPLLVGDRALGVLGLGFPEPRAFLAGDRAFLAAAAAQCAQALERALLHEAAIEAGRRSALLAREGRELAELATVGERGRRAVELAAPGLADAALLEVQSGDRVRRWTAGPDDLLALAVADEDDDLRRVRVPLPRRGETSGVLVLVRDEGRFRADELPLLSAFADRAALALENARLAEHERDVARALQRSLLAGPLPHDARLTLATAYRPAVQGLEVGGDWYDAFPLGPDRVAIVVGDVVGRGLQAATAMGQLRSAIRALASVDLGPAALLERLDAFVEHVPAARMATVAYGELELVSGSLSLACAGHPPPLVGGRGGLRYLWGGRSAPLGAYLGMPARTACEVRLAPGDRLLLYTDGLVERRDRPLDEGLDALAVAFSALGGVPVRDLAHRLPDVPGLAAPASDDVCVLCLGFGVTDEYERLIPADPEALAALRADLRTWLAGNEVPPDDRDAVVIACGEAVANSIEHGYGADHSGIVAVRGRLRERHVEVDVADHGAWRPPHGQPDRGRGLTIMRGLMDEVALERDDGTTVRMRLNLRRAPRR